MYDNIQNLQHINGKLKAEPILSVIVPIYNSAKTLRKALESLHLQTAEGLEFICIDDCSVKSEEIDIVNSFIEKDSRFVLFKHTNNCGYGKTVNDGISISNAKWISILEPDDYIDGQFYERCLSEITLQEIEPDIIKTPYIRNVFKNRNYMKLQCSYRHRIKKTLVPERINKNNKHLLAHHPSIWSGIYNKNFLKNNNIFFPEYSGSGWADNEFFYNTLLRGTIYYIDKPFYVYTEETEEEFADFIKNNWSLPIDRWCKLDCILNDLKDSIDDFTDIQQIHIERGFTYLDGVCCNIDNAKAKKECEKLFSSIIDSKTVFNSKNIPPYLKEKYALYKNIDPKENKWKAIYAMSLVKEGFYTIRNNGIKHTMNEVARVLTKRL